MRGWDQPHAIPGRLCSRPESACPPAPSSATNSTRRSFPVANNKFERVDVPFKQPPQWQASRGQSNAATSLSDMVPLSPAPPNLSGKTAVREARLVERSNIGARISAILIVFSSARRGLFRNIPRGPWAEPAGAGHARRRAPGEHCPRRGQDVVGVLVQLGLDVVLGGAPHVQVRRVVGVADPPEVVAVGACRCWGRWPGTWNWARTGSGPVAGWPGVPGRPGRASSPSWYSTLPP